MKKFFVIATIVFIASCVAPMEPPLSEKEKTFIAGIEKKYHGKTGRDIDAILLVDTDNPNQKGIYSLVTKLNCDTLYKLGQDSIKIQQESYLIAKQLLIEVLESNRKYNELVIAFSCDTSSHKYKNLIFAYKVDSLLLQKEGDN